MSIWCHFTVETNKGCKSSVVKAFKAASYTDEYRIRRDDVNPYKWYISIASDGRYATDVISGTLERLKERDPQGNYYIEVSHLVYF